MRVNIYHHEVPFMATRAELVKKVADTGNEFYGARFYTEPPLEHEAGDDDSAAVTIWFPWTKAGGHDTRGIQDIANHLLEFCAIVEAVKND